MARVSDHGLYKEKIEAFSKSVHFLSLNLLNENKRKLSTLLNEFYSFLNAILDNGSRLEPQHCMTLLMTLLHLFKPRATENLIENDTIAEPSLSIIHYLMSKTILKQTLQPKFTEELLVFFGTLIYRDDKTEQLSEEVKQLLVSCISATLPAKYKEGRYSSFEMSVYYCLVEVIRDESFLPKASQGIKGLIDIIQHEKNVQLRLEASVVLNQYLIDNIKNTDMIATLFPGTASKLCSTLAQGPEKESHLVVSTILHTLGELIQVVLNDENNDTFIEVKSLQDVVKAYSSSAEQDSGEGKKLKSKAWYEKTKTALFAMLTLALKNQSSTDWRKRLAYLDFSYTLLSTCTRTLDNCVKLLLKVMLLYRDDPYSEITNKSSIYMESLRYYPSFEKTIVPILQEELYECIMKFPKHMISGDEQDKTSTMSLISGIILFLGQDSKTSLSMALPKASDGWMTALEIDKYSLHTLEEKTSQKFIEQAGEKNQSVPLYPKIRFKHIVNDDTAETLVRMLNIIGSHCDLQSWIHHYLRYISTDSLDQSEPQAAFIIHSLLAGATSKDGYLEQDEIVDSWIDFDDEQLERPEALKSTSTQVLSEAVEMLTLAASVSTRTPSSITKAASPPIVMDDDSSYVLNVCFGLQLVGLTTSVIASEVLQERLITMLYPLLAHLGSSNVYVHAYALITLNTIALTCGLENARDLAITNIDYVINMISQHISIMSIYNRVPFVLKALINVTGPDSIKFLEDTVHEICDALDRHHDNSKLSSELCGVLAEIVYVVEKDLTHYEDDVDKKNDQEPSCEQSVSEEIRLFIQNKEDSQGHFDTERKSMDDIGKYFLDRQEKGLNENLTLEQAINEANISSSKNNQEESNSEKEVSEKEKETALSYEETMVKDIMEKASYFLTAPSPQLRSQILQLLGSGVSVLSKQVSVLNTLVHDTWTFIVNRFGDKENYVVYQAARLIETISTVSTDFLSKKFAQDIWPRFKALLRKGADPSISNVKSSNYSIHSTYHRTQLCILKSLKNIMKHVPVRQPLVKEILEETRFYYSYDKVHLQLRETCFELFESLYTQQSDTVWLYQLLLNTEFQDKLKVPPSPLLEEFVLPEWIKPKVYVTEQNQKPTLLK